MTKKQLELLQFIERFTGENGYSPSFIEMMEAINVSSKSGIFRLLRGLEERGRIRRLRQRKRAIEVVKEPRFPTSLSSIPDSALLAEAKRRHMALCHVMRDDYGQRILMEIHTAHP